MTRKKREKVSVRVMWCRIAEGKIRAKTSGATVQVDRQRTSRVVV